MNKQEAIRNFLSHLEDLTGLPLISDFEMETLYGVEVAGALAELGRYNDLEKVCRKCADKCCPLVDCEFYVPSMTRCSIHPFRPVLCRMHFCSQFAEKDKVMIKTIGDIFLEGLIEAEGLHRNRAGLLDCPPFCKVAPLLVAAISPVIDRLNQGSLDEISALEMIRTRLVSCPKPYSEGSG